MSDTNTEGERPSREMWARAYARQAQSDWDLYALLEQNDTPRCHRVHYLQMASEKIAKAYRFRDTSTLPEQLLRHHVGFTKFFNAFLLSARVKSMYEGKGDQLAQITKRCRQLALELEKLAPAVDSSNRPANPEYPWQHGSTVVVPHDHEFPNLSLLDAQAGRTFLKLLHLAIAEFETVAIA